MVLSWHNAEISAKILSGFVWNDIPVWLSAENQSNFKAIYDLAFQTSGATLPVTFKLGEDIEGYPIYFTFEDMGTFTDFYTKSVKHVQDTLVSGRALKDAFNQGEYE